MVQFNFQACHVWNFLGIDHKYNIKTISPTFTHIPTI
jgi:hypothetical protein